MNYTTEARYLLHIRVMFTVYGTNVKNEPVSCIKMADYHALVSISYNMTNVSEAPVVSPSVLSVSPPPCKDKRFP